MASTNFIDKVTVVQPDWLNEVNGTVWTLFNAATTASAGRTALGLGTIATQDASNVNITGGAIANLSSPIPVASGGTGTTTSTGSGATVKADSPTITNLLISGSIISAATGGGDIVRFVGTSGSAENSLRVDQTQTTSGTALKLSNSGLNKQATLRGNSDGGFTFYVNQAAGGASTSGTSALTVTAAGAANFPGAVSENSTRVVSRNSAYTSGLTALTSTSGLWTTGFSTAAFLYQVFIQCTSADANYNVGTVINLSASNFSGGTFTTAIDPGTPGTIVWYLTGGITLADGVLGTATAFTLSKWSVFVRAWQ